MAPVTLNPKLAYFCAALWPDFTPPLTPTPSDWCTAPRRLLSRLGGAFGDGPRVLVGATWTTDAPFRETETAIAEARSRGILAVEMEAAGLYAFAQARNRAVVCLAHVTNQMGTIEGDFEKGEAEGSADALAVVVAHRGPAWLTSRRRQGFDHAAFADIAAATTTGENRPQLAGERLQVGDPRLDLGQVRLGNPVHARAILAATLREFDQPADLVLRESQLSRPPDETQSGDGLGPVKTLAAFAAGRCGQKAGLLEIADGDDLDARLAGQIADAQMPVGHGLPL